MRLVSRLGSEADDRWTVSHVAAILQLLHAGSLALAKRSGHPTLGASLSWTSRTNSNTQRLRQVGMLLGRARQSRVRCVHLISMACASDTLIFSHLRVAEHSASRQLFEWQ